jgi:sec-independent protein translocase protein TatA
MHLGVLLFFSNLFSTDMVLIVIVALVLFGGDKLPGIAKTIGKGLRDFKDASEGVKREINNQIYAYEEKKQDQRLDGNGSR